MDRQQFYRLATSVDGGYIETQRYVVFFKGKHALVMRPKGLIDKAFEVHWGSVVAAPVNEERVMDLRRYSGLFMIWQTAPGPEMERYLLVQEPASMSLITRSTKTGQWTIQGETSQSLPFANDEDFFNHLYETYYPKE